MTDQSWHSQKIDGVYDELDTSAEGLSTDEAAQRLEEEGPNEIKSGKKVSPLKILLDQFNDFLIWILIAAAIVSLYLGESTDAILIFLILIANGIFGFVQDYKAEESIAALKEMSSTKTRVLRDGEKQEVDAKHLVPGDVIFIEAGDAIPADARIVSQDNLKVDESALTGESVGVQKETGVLDEETALAERDNMVYKNTIVERGSAKAIVVSTGMNTEVGKIATSIQEAETRETPFQREVNKLGKKIGIGILIVSAVVGGFEFLFGNSSIIDILLVSIGLAVAAVPEGLPAVVTLSLALGSKKMVKKNALVRRLPVVESLGSVDVICTDKTGTLTEDRMTVRRIYDNNGVIKVSGTGYDPEGDFTVDDETVDTERFSELLRCGVLCNNADTGKTEEGEKTYLGDPTEVSLLVSARKAGMDKEELRQEYGRVGEVSFTSGRKRMTTVHETPEGGRVAYMKGAPEIVLERCDRIWIDGEVRELTDEKREEVIQQNEAFASDALRVLGFAYREDPGEASEEIEQEMIFLGLQGMIDPPRDEVREALEDCRDAGIDVVMVTGDNRTTAKAIGAEIGFNAEKAYTGTEVEKMSDEELAEAVEEVEIFARVSPDHKLRILETLQKNGHIVAMTGDGVNDAPAVKKADVGISMGIRGTDVTEQASSMVLLDDNFVTIRDAVAEGRGIFDNIRKFVNYLLSANAGEVLLIFFGTILGLGLVLEAVHLLWINLLTDGLPALALGADPKSDGIMDRPPREKDEGVITSRMLTSIGGIGVIMAIALLPLFYINLPQGIETAQTTVFTALVLFEFVRIQLIRRRYEQSLMTNKWLLIALVGSFALQLGILYSPLHEFFEIVPLGVVEWLEIGGSLVLFVLLSLVLVALEDRFFE